MKLCTKLHNKIKIKIECSFREGFIYAVVLTDIVVNIHRLREIEMMHWYHFGPRNGGTALSSCPLFLSYPSYSGPEQFRGEERCEFPKWGLRRRPAEIEHNTFWPLNLVSSGGRFLCVIL